MQTRDMDRLVGCTLYSADGDKIGKINEIYVDQQTGQPEWVTVNTGWFGSRVSFVPLTKVTVRGEEAFVPFDKEMVKEAPTAETDGALSPDEEQRLYRHYGFGDMYGRSTTGMTGDGRGRGRETDRGMTRSEEELRVGTQRTEAGQARLRKWVETEHVKQTVPVQREEARVVREPVTGADVDRGTSSRDIKEDAEEVILHEERPVVGKETVPKERVRLEKEVVNEERPVEADIRKERIDVEGDVRRR